MNGTSSFITFTNLDQCETKLYSVHVTFVGRCAEMKLPNIYPKTSKRVEQIYLPVLSKLNNHLFQLLNTSSCFAAHFRYVDSSCGLTVLDVNSLQINGAG